MRDRRAIALRWGFLTFLCVALVVGGTAPAAGSVEDGTPSTCWRVGDAEVCVEVIPLEIFDGPDPVGATVMIMEERAKSGTYTPTLRDFTGEKMTAQQIIEEIGKGQYDAYMFDPFESERIDGEPRPLNICDNETDCRRAMEAACRLLGTELDVMVFSALNRRCDATCENGRGVNGVCSNPR